MSVGCAGRVQPQGTVADRLTKLTGLALEGIDTADIGAVILCAGAHPGPGAVSR